MNVTENQWQRRLLEHLNFLAENALKPDLLERFTDRLHDDWRCSIAILSYEAGQQLSSEGIIRDFDQALVLQFREHYYALNPYPAIVERNGLLNATVSLAPYFSRPKLWKTEYYNEFMRPQCLEYVMALSIDFGGGARTSVSLYRGDHDGGAFTREDARRLEMLRPHLRQTLLFRRLWETQTATGWNTLSAVEGLRESAVALDENGARPLNTQGESTLLRTSRKCAGPALEGKVIPFGDGRLDLRHAAKEERTSAIVISLPGQAILRACQAWQLTERELQVLHSLQEGQTAREIASYLQIAISTVQTHVKSIHRKSGMGSTRKLLRALTERTR